MSARSEIFAIASVSDEKNRRFSRFILFPEEQFSLPYIFSFRLPANTMMRFFIFACMSASLVALCRVIVLADSIVKNDTQSVAISTMYLANAMFHINTIIASDAFRRFEVCSENDHVTFVGF